MVFNKNACCVKICEKNGNYKRNSHVVNKAHVTVTTDMPYLTLNLFFVFFLSKLTKRHILSYHILIFLVKKIVVFLEDFLEICFGISLGVHFSLNWVLFFFKG